MSDSANHVATARALGEFRRSRCWRPAWPSLQRWRPGRPGPPCDMAWPKLQRGRKSCLMPFC